MMRIPPPAPLPVLPPGPQVPRLALALQQLRTYRLELALAPGRRTRRAAEQWE
jgi:hypothetical protein